MLKDCKALKPHRWNSDVFGDEPLDQAFVANIKESGVLCPLTIKGDGTIISGHRRWRAAMAAGLVEVPIKVEEYVTEEQERKAFVDYNRQREKSFSQKMREAAFIEETERIAANGRQGTRTDLILPETRITSAKYFAEVTKPERTSDKVAEQIGIGSGRQYEKAKKVWKAAKTGNADAVKLVEDIDQNKITIHEAYKKVEKIKRSEELAEEREKIARSGAVGTPSGKWNIYHGNMRTIELNKKYDFIITDPPYPREYMPLYKALAERATEWLKPEGLLVCMCGQSYLNQIYAIFDQHLAYYWTACFLTPHQPTPLRQRQVNTSWKPLLIYGKQQNYTGKTFGDVFTSEQAAKNHHRWEQSESGMIAIVKQICLPGQTVLDPFCGAGTTGIAALQHGCLFDGIDVDETSVNITKGRLSDQTPL